MFKIYGTIYVLGMDFKIEMYYESLWYLTIQSTLSWRQCRCVEFLQHFFFDIQYVKGKENVIVNALSKRKWANAMLVVKGELIDDVKRKYVKCPLFTTLFIIILYTSI